MLNSQKGSRKYVEEKHKYHKPYKQREQYTYIRTYTHTHTHIHTHTHTHTIFVLSSVQEIKSK